MSAENKDSFATRWSRFIIRLHEPYLHNVLHPVTQISARNPKITIFSITIGSFLLLALGLFTNFEVETDGDLLWTPQDARPVSHEKWISQASGFAVPPRPTILFFHDNGNNVLGRQQISLMFEALDTIRSLPDYDSVCAASSFTDSNGVSTCEITGALRFWNLDVETFNSQATSDADVIATLSGPTYPDGAVVGRAGIMGFPQADESGTLTDAKSYTMIINLPETDDAEEFEEVLLDALFDLSDRWEVDNLTMEFMAERSFDDEFGEAIVRDIPLIPAVFVVMSIFTSIVFSKRHKVKSRALLGLGAVVSVFLSLVVSFGLLFTIGTPFTSMTQLLPFVIFGIGLDDSFIIMGAYSRTDEAKETTERVYETIQEVGTSVTLTTLTSTLAFALGTMTSIPSVDWLCLYAFPTIIFVYLYQITYFIALITLDDRRIRNNRRDVFCCFTLEPESDINKLNTAKESEVKSAERGETMSSESSSADARATEEGWVDRFMTWYAENLLKTPVKIIVVVAFAALLGLCAWSASQLTQEFRFQDVLPKGSYVSSLFDEMDIYTERSLLDPYVYFRNVDQSDPNIQQEMLNYVNDLSQMKSVGSGPEFFWLVDFQKFVSDDASLAEQSFDEQLSAFLSVPAFAEMYGADIVRDEEGKVFASRTVFYMDNVDEGDVKNQIDALEEQQAVSGRQPVNKGKSDWSFFTFDDIYFIWSFYSSSVDELILTTILGVVSVTVISLLFIPHWTAALFTLPMICILYVDLLGVLQWAGIHINAVSYVTAVMSIGLLVDFILHIILRYYECPGNRREKTVAMVKSMGVSILTGGISTFLGTLPLAFSTSTIFETIFYAFLGLATLGLGHGLILLPVLLSTFGPEDDVGMIQKEVRAAKKTNVETSSIEDSASKA